MSLATAIWRTCRVDTGLFHFNTAVIAHRLQSLGWAEHSPTTSAASHSRADTQ